MIVAVEWIALILSLLSFLIFVILALRRPKQAAGGGPVLHGGEELTAAAKLAESISKVIDSLAKAGPLTTSLVASVAFLLIAAYVALHAIEPKSDKKQGAEHKTSTGLELSVEKCVVSGFGDGASDLGIGRNSLARFQQEPQSCLEEFLSQKWQRAPTLIFFIGHVDRRELQAPVRRIYGTNFTLAFQRAASVQAYTLAQYSAPSTIANGSGGTRLSPGQLQSRFVALAAGPSHISGHIPAQDLSSDRSVEVIGLWQSAQP
jgi:hypothetical protein